tara:strand:- start:738 stop:971 length:234 start_codon:yes stop_codon:yes gene_type:complete
MAIKARIMKFIEDYTGFLIAIAGAFAAAGWWIINNLLTNKSQIKLLEQKTDMMHELLKEMRDDQKEMRRDIQNLAVK